MTFNVRYENAGDFNTRSWSRRLPGIVKMIRREGPDVIGIQEALHGQVADLRASLPDYEFYGIGRDDGGRVGEYSGVFYKSSRFVGDAGDRGTFWLSATPEQPGSRTWGNEIPRVAAWIRLVDLESGRGFYCFNTHWDHRNQNSREEAALLMGRRIDRRKHPAEPVALLGDFNSIESNPGLAFLTGKRSKIKGSPQQWTGGMINCFQALHPKVADRRTLHFWTDSLKGNLMVDHILVSRGAKIRSSSIVSKDAPMISDHYPVVARVTFPPVK